MTTTRNQKAPSSSTRTKSKHHDLLSSESGVDYYDYYDYQPSVRTSVGRRQLFTSKAGLGGGKAATPAKTSLLGSFNSHYGSYAGGYNPHDKCDNGISIGLLLTTLLGIGVMFFTLFTKITMAVMRRKKRSLEHNAETDPLSIILDHFPDFVLGGMLTSFLTLTFKAFIDGRLLCPNDFSKC